MEQFWHGLLIGCIFTATVCSSEDTIPRREVPNSDEYQDEITAAEDHEHHRIIIVVPKEVPHHVNHVHTYKLSGKGIPLIHSGKVVHDHKHSGKVAHEHGHTGKSTHSHKHAGAYGHQHKHLGYMGHKHFGKVGVVGHGGHKPVQPQPPRHSPFDHHNRGHHPLLRNAAHQLHLQHQQQAGDYLVQQHGNAGGSSGVLQQGGGRRPTSGGGHIQFVPSSKPRGLGSFMPAEIQQYVQHGAVVQQQHQQLQQHQQQLQHQQHHQQQQQLQHQQHQQHVEYDDDESGGGRGVPPPAYNVIHLRVPDHQEPNVVKHVDIDLVNNVAQLQTSEKQQPVTANFKSVTQYNKVIGHGRAVAAANAEDEFDAQTDDEDLGGELLLDDVGYRFGEGYRLAMDTAGGGGPGARDFSAAQEQDEEEVDESFKEPSAGADDDPSDGSNNAYSQTYSLQF